ncbi:MAG: sulfotransferase [Cyclobacteriaceae bacterium]|nr:sulfotransferase [Cyclobacteriaceae bacterium]
MKYIQFIGTQRSGSNLLRVMLNQVPAISAPHPPHILRTFFPLLKHYEDITVERNFFTLVNDVCNWVNLNPVPWEIQLDPIQVAEKCKTRSLVEIFRVVYELKAQSDNANYWCCKSMECIYYVDEIEAAGLKPFYIYIYRDGRDVALSYKKAIVGPKHIFHLATKWKKEQELSIALLKSLSAERYVVVKYEELITDTNKVMHEICAKLNITFTKEIFDYFHAHESQMTASSGAMWENLTKPIMHNNFNKFKSELSEEEIYLFESIAGETLANLNYETVHWPNTNGKFAKEELEKFDLENERLKRTVLENADKVEIEHRIPQENLLKQIKEGLSIQHE